VIRPIVGLSLTLALAVSAQRLGAQQPNDRAFHWAGPVASGHWLRIHNLSGAIHVEKSSSNQVEVDGEKHGDRGDPAEIHFEVRRTGADSGDVLICALWGHESSCDVEGDHYHHHGHHEDFDGDEMSVRFTVRLPEGVNVGVSTVNGDVSVNGATAEVHATTVNGTVQATTLGGPVEASTVNGDVDVHMANTGRATNLDYSTVNGSVTVTLPAKIDAEVDLSTVNGNVQSDYPLTLQGHIDPKHLHATIGSGGLRIRASTVNGQIELRKT
jgi:Putative adhesin